MRGSSRNLAFRGFTLLESMIALMIVSVALAGTVAGFVTVDSQLRDAQLRQVKTFLLDAKAQRMMLEKKIDLASISTTWTPDPTQTIVNAINTPIMRPNPDPDIDFSVGAYFAMSPAGEVQQLNMPAGTLCTATAVPAGSYCREVRATAGMPGGGALPAGVSWTSLSPAVAPTTYWARIYRKGENPNSMAVLYQQVFVQ